MNGFELIMSINETFSRAKEALKSITPSAAKAARAEAKYRAIIAKNTLRLKSEGYAASLIHDLARGQENACEAFVEKEIAASENKTAHELLMLCKKEIDYLRECIKREWSGGAE